jgi:type III pantothenate kinase
MRLVIDSGNTLVKIALFDRDTIIYKTEQDLNASIRLDSIFKKHTIDSAIISDVSNGTKQLADQLPNGLPVVFMSGQTPTPLNIKYMSTDSLGSDRLAAAVFASDFFPGNNVLVIQTGTCITYDLVSETDEYLGGAISPGLEMKLKALNTFTAKIPLVKKKEISFITGNNTENSILSGIVNGSIAEIDGMIDRYTENYPGLKVIIGGGDIFFFDKKLKNRIFAIENLVLKGLNLILEYNVNLEK